MGTTGSPPGLPVISATTGTGEPGAGPIERRPG